MSRVPNFAVVGRMGLPLAAAATGLALWSSGTLAAQPGSTVAGQAVSAPNLLSAPAVGVAVPSVVMGEGDGLPMALKAGSQAAVVQVWLAAGSPASAATVYASAGQVTGCTAVALMPGRVNVLHCTLIAPAGPYAVTVAASVAGRRFRTSYAHRVS